MESRVERRQRNLVARTQRRLDRLYRQMQRSQRSQRSQILKRANDPQEIYEALVARSIAQIFTRSLTMDALTKRMNATTTPSGEPGDVTEKMCHDIRGKDRACCNTALACFDDVANVIEDLEHAPNDFTLLSACRKVSEELKRDRVCIKQGLSSCDGTGKAVLQRRFDNRINNLYDQFYKHCQGRTVAPTTPTPNATTINPGVTSFSTQKPVLPGRNTTAVPTIGDNGTYTNNPSHDTRHNHTSGIDSGAIVVAAVTGGAILLVVVIIAIVLWCKNRKDRYESDGSASSAGVIFQKRPDSASGEGQQRNNNNKHAATRQDSTVYAEIDERFVNPGYKPPLPPDMTMDGYLHPISDEDVDHYNQPSNVAGSVPMATTRGQLSYGAILAANTNPATDESLFYYSTALTPPADRQSGRELPRIPQSGNENENEANRSLFASKPHLRKDNAYVECHGESNDGLETYEEPVSAQNSVKYVHGDSDLSPPNAPAPGIPVDAKVSPGNKHKMAVKVLPSNPFESRNASSSPKTSNPNTPVAKPRRKKQSTGDNPDAEDAMTTEENGVKPLELDFDKLKMSNRDSTMSDSSVKSSHHYFVLEPESAPRSPSELDYENSVSSSKLV